MKCSLALTSFCGKKFSWKLVFHTNNFEIKERHKHHIQDKIVFQIAKGCALSVSVICHFQFRVASMWIFYDVYLGTLG